MKWHGDGPLSSRLVRGAMETPSRLSKSNPSFWEDVRDVLLDPEPDSWSLETVRRWLRDELEADLMERLGRGNTAHMVQWACRLSPRMIWKLPHSRSKPPKRFHRRIVAVILPHRLPRLERELATRAFHSGMPYGRRK